MERAPTSVSLQYGRSELTAVTRVIAPLAYVAGIVATMVLGRDLLSVGVLGGCFGVSLLGGALIGRTWAMMLAATFPAAIAISLLSPAPGQDLYAPTIVLVVTPGTVLCALGLYLGVRVRKLTTPSSSLRA